MDLHRQASHPGVAWPLPTAWHEHQVAVGQRGIGYGAALGYRFALAPTCSSQRRNACTIGPASNGVSFGASAISLS